MASYDAGYQAGRRDERAALRVALKRMREAGVLDQDVEFAVGEILAEAPEFGPEDEPPGGAMILDMFPR